MSGALRVGIVGCGVVGGGVVETLLARGRDLAPRPIELVKVADIVWKDSSVPKQLRCRNASEILDDPSIDVVVELVGGTTFAYEVIDRAIGNGKDVVTANKALLAERGEALFKKAESHGREIAFEAAVAGGIPILSALRGGLAANTITTIYGILNGTTNYILTRMSQTGATFEDALAGAQKLGFAEADPTLDLEGIDAAHKIQLLASLALGQTVPMKKIPVQGIRNVSSLDIAYAQQLGCRIKLLAVARMIEAGLEISIAPTLVPESHPLARVDNEINAVFVVGDLVGEAVFIGRGAGRRPTAAAVVADLIEIAKGSGGTYVEKMTAARKVNPVSAEKYLSGYYLRISAAEKPGALAALTGVLGKAGISIASVVQLERTDSSQPVPVALLTHETTAARINSAVAKINKLTVVRAKTVVFPVVE